MAPGGVHSLLLLTLLGLFAAVAQTETVADAVPTQQIDNLETSSGGGPLDLTTKDPFFTENGFTFEYEDATSEPTDGVLGPGAITAIVIAVVLGAAVLIALIAITLKKFTAA